MSILNGKHINEFSEDMLNSISEKKDFIKAYQGCFLIILLCGSLFGISNMFFISAINNTSVANTVMILSTAP